MKNIFSIVILAFLHLNIIAQQIDDNETNKCGIAPAFLKSFEETLGDNWGYSYDSLLIDIENWNQNEYIEIQSIGQSVNGRNLFELTITDTNIPETNKHRIYIHARTHPNEVQSFWVTDEIINYAKSDTEFGNFIRESFILHIIPMYNPDGVELEYNRENANYVNIESNWNSSSPEVEVQNLRSRFAELMESNTPIEVALNMHSAYECNRYFVYHDANGTSEEYATMEEDFIESIRYHFPNGIESYDHYISWTSSTPDQYPESWWWRNFQDQVIALTYEDMNCNTAGNYKKTANALINGIANYYDLYFEESTDSVIDVVVGINERSFTYKIYPNPFNERLTIAVDENICEIYVKNIWGQTIKTLQKTNNSNGEIIWDGTDNWGNLIPNGIYYIHFNGNNIFNTVSVIKI